MADVLKHLETVREGRQMDWWEARSSLYTKPYDHKFDNDFTSHYLDRYRLQLVSQTGFAVQWADEDAMAHATKAARRSLVNHLYRTQLDISHEIMHALYGGETREKIAERVSQLIETMTER